jgi:hypothetical protein
MHKSYFKGVFSFDESRICMASYVLQIHPRKLASKKDAHETCEKMWLLSKIVPLETFGFRDIQEYYVRSLSNKN